MADLFHSHSRSSRLDKVLGDLLAQAPELQAAAVVSFDGLPMASALPAGMDEDRVAAMSAALLSLGERAAENFGRGSLSQVYVEGENGTVFLVSADDEAVLVAVGAKGAKVGLLMFEVRRSAASVADALRADDAAALVETEPVIDYDAVAAAEAAAAAAVAVPMPEEVPADVEYAEYAEYSDAALAAASAPNLQLVESVPAYEQPEPYIYPVPAEPVPGYDQSYAPLAEEVDPPGPLSPWGYPMIGTAQEAPRPKSDLGWTGYVSNGAPNPPPQNPQNGATDSWS